MASSNYPTTQYTSEKFVESCGAIVFDLSEPKRVCLINYTKTNEWLLPKGRRSRGESRRQAALREVQEETGYRCHIHPVTMPTRAPHQQDEQNAPDTARVCRDMDEPFMVTLRELNEKSEAKFIWWFIAAVDEAPERLLISDGDFKAEFFTFDEALRKLKFREDCEVLSKAINLLERG
ncbi:hypothetical protein BJX99DRAFT_202954 [Aspergillus californicus]